MGLSKNQLKLINSLQQKKYRQKHQLFIAEGVKVVNEFLQSDVELYQLFVTEEAQGFFKTDQLTIISEVELKKISTLKSPNMVLGVFKIPKTKQVTHEGLTVVLDGINDPGNLGTIIRLCDWFGVNNLVCSKNTVDCYNQKVIQSTMGSITRVNVSYTDLIPFFDTVQSTIYIADMDGENVYQATLPKEAVIVMGNEANGVSNEIKSLVNKKLTIPRFGSIQVTESLNVATATAILLSEFNR